MYDFLGTYLRVVGFILPARGYGAVKVESSDKGRLAMRRSLIGARDLVCPHLGKRAALGKKFGMSTLLDYAAVFEDEDPEVLF